MNQCCHYFVFCLILFLRKYIMSLNKYIYIRKWIKAFYFLFDMNKLNIINAQY